MTQEQINQYDEQGREHGVWKGYWHDDGTIQYITEYHHGEIHGTREYYELGVLIRKSQYFQGEIHGSEEWYDYNGVLTSINHYRHGKNLPLAESLQEGIWTKEYYLKVR